MGGVGFAKARQRRERDVAGPPRTGELLQTTTKSCAG
jgi:hypothetical protein